MSWASAAAFAIGAVVATAAGAGTLPGINVEPMANASGFVTSLAFDSHGDLFYSTREGKIFRLEQYASIEVATVDAANDGNPFSNAGLLGIVFADDNALIAHWVSRDLTADVIGRVNTNTSEVTELARLPCSLRGQPCSSEHHGGNLTVSADGSIFFGIGDIFLPAVHPQNPESAGGKIHRLDPSGAVSMYASGLRNPFDMVYDETLRLLVVADNGTGPSSDELNLVSTGDNLGWPFTSGTQPPVSGMKVPEYVFPAVVAPTGMSAVNVLGGYAMGGVLVGSYVTKTLYYFADLRTRPVAAPLTVLQLENAPIIDVVQAEDGAVFLATPVQVLKVGFPSPGDVNGDGRVDNLDLRQLREELEEAQHQPTIRAQEGSVRSSWGADANQDGVIDDQDMATLRTLVPGRRRVVRR